MRSLRDSDLLEKGEIKQYYIEVSEIIRQYIEGRYFIIAMEMTTTEVLEGLTGAELPEEDFQYFSDFLNRCDLVKFAKVIPSEKQNLEILDMACEIVNRTKVVIEEPAAEVDEVPQENQDETLGTVSSDEKSEDLEPLKIPDKGKDELP